MPDHPRRAAALPLRPTLWTLCIVLILTTFPAVAITACAEREQVVQRLSRSYGETQRSLGLSSGAGLVELFASDLSGSWTITVTLPDGRACLVVSGRHFQAFPADGRNGDRPGTAPSGKLIGDRSGPPDDDLATGQKGDRAAVTPSQIDKGPKTYLPRFPWPEHPSATAASLRAAAMQKPHSPAPASGDRPPAGMRDTCAHRCEGLRIPRQTATYNVIN